jgi:hypothetical protein
MICLGIVIVSLVLVRKDVSPSIGFSLMKLFFTEKLRHCFNKPMRLLIVLLPIPFSFCCSIKSYMIPSVIKFDW